VPVHRHRASANVPHRVLVVEDDALVGEVLHDMLENHYEVVLAVSVKEALSVIAAERFDVVLLDYNLTDGYGLAVAERADKLGIPIVWMSGNMVSFDTFGGSPETGGENSQSLLTKPFTNKQLLDVLSNARRRS
jgi:CheY-like chemotaxis protein